MVHYKFFFQFSLLKILIVKIGHFGWYIQKCLDYWSFPSNTSKHYKSSICCKRTGKATNRHIISVILTVFSSLRGLLPGHTSKVQKKSMGAKGGWEVSEIISTRHYDYHASLSQNEHVMKSAWFYMKTIYNDRLQNYLSDLHELKLRMV